MHDCRAPTLPVQAVQHRLDSGRLLQTVRHLKTYCLPVSLPPRPARCLSALPCLALVLLPYRDCRSVVAQLVVGECAVEQRSEVVRVERQRSAVLLYRSTVVALAPQRKRTRQVLLGSPVRPAMHGTQEPASGCTLCCRAAGYPVSSTAHPLPAICASAALMTQPAQHNRSPVLRRGLAVPMA